MTIGRTTGRMIDSTMGSAITETIGLLAICKVTPLLVEQFCFETHTQLCVYIYLFIFIKKRRGACARARVSRCCTFSFFLILLQHEQPRIPLDSLVFVQGTIGDHMPATPTIPAIALVAATDRAEVVTGSTSRGEVVAETTILGNQKRSTGETRTEADAFGQMQMMMIAILHLKVTGDYCFHLGNPAQPRSSSLSSSLSPACLSDWSEGSFSGSETATTRTATSMTTSGLTTSFKSRSPHRLKASNQRARERAL